MPGGALSAPHGPWPALQERQPWVLICPSPAHKDHAVFSQAVNQAARRTVRSQVGLDLPEAPRAALRRTRRAMPPASQSPSGVAKAPYLRPIPVMNPELCGCCAPPSLLALLAALKTRRTGVQAAAGWLAAFRRRLAGSERS